MGSCQSSAAVVAETKRTAIPTASESCSDVDSTRMVPPNSWGTCDIETMLKNLEAEQNSKSSLTASWGMADISDLQQALAKQGAVAA